MKRHKTKKMRRPVAWLLMLIIVFVMSVSGCMQEKSDDEVNNKDDKIVISVGGYFCDEKLSPELYEYQLDVVRRFEEAYPNVRIVDSKWNFDADTYLSSAEGNTLPTTYYVPLTEAYTIINLGYAADITEEFQKRGFYENTRDFMIENISKGGRIYLIPASNYDQGLFINMDLYRRVGLVDADETPYQPKTWDELAIIAKKMKDETGVAGFVIPTSGRAAGWRFTPIAWSYGTVFEEKVDGKWKAKFDSPECAEALQFVKDLKWKYDVLPDMDIDSEKYREVIARDEAAMGIMEENLAQKVIDSYGMKRDNIGIVSMPAGPKRRVTLMGGGYRVINKNATSEQIKAAMDWTEFTGVTVNVNDEFIMNFEENLNSYKRLGYIIGIEMISPWNDSAETEIYRNKNNVENLNVNYNHIKLFNDKSSVEIQMEAPVEAQALYDILGGVVNKVLTDENADPSQLLREAAKEFQEKYLDYLE